MQLQSILARLTRICKWTTSKSPKLHSQGWLAMQCSTEVLSKQNLSQHIFRGLGKWATGGHGHAADSSQPDGLPARGGHILLLSASSSRTGKYKVISEPFRTSLSYLNLDTLRFFIFFPFFPPLFFPPFNSFYQRRKLVAQRQRVWIYRAGHWDARQSLNIGSWRFHVIKTAEVTLKCSLGA